MAIIVLLALACRSPSPEPRSTEPTPEVQAVEPAPPAAAPEAPSPPESDVVLDIPAIAGKAEAAIAEELGEPESCSSVKQGRLCAYRGGNVEVVFIDGKADWITIYGADAPSPDHVALDGRVEPAALARLGLPSGTATSSPLALLFTGTVAGTVGVSLFNVSLNDDTLSYAYVKVATP